MPLNFFRKNSQKISEIFSTFRKSKKKTIVFAPKLVQNHYIDQNLAKFSLKTKKRPIFHSKPQLFKIFGAFSPQSENLEFYATKNPDFSGVGAPWGRGLPQIKL